MKTIKALFNFFAILLVIFILLILLLNSFLSNNLSKRQIFNLVEKYSNTILVDIDEDNFEDTLDIKGVTNVVSHDVMDSHCGGKGFGSATSYYGFYYYGNDEPVVMFNGNISKVDESEFIADGKGFSYREKNIDGTVSDNTYYTEKILTGFYYYEWHF